MDRRRTRARLLICAAAALLAAAPVDPPLRAARWLAPGHRLANLTRQPRECLAHPTDPESVRSIEIGRAAFGAPLLLGGQAARAGLSCASCHRNGRGNADFLFPGISGEAGTADVTASLLSSHRGDGVFNPKPIPDLAEPAGKRKISRNPDDPALPLFIHGLITQEFDGPEPPERVLRGLSDYVRAISPEACIAGATAVTLSTYLEDVSRALDAAGEVWRQGDAPATRLLLGAARSSLGSIDERYASPRFAVARERLRAADLDLAAIQQALTSDPQSVPLRIAAWRAMMPRWSAPLRAGEQASLFDPRLLRRALAED